MVLKRATLRLDDRSAPTRIAFDLDTATHTQAVMYERISAGSSHEPETLKLLVDLLRGQSGIFIDVGAHIGFYSLVAKAVMAEPSLAYAFEPSPFTFVRLLRNAALNGIAVTAANMAVGQAFAVVNLYLFADDGRNCLWNPQHASRRYDVPPPRGVPVTQVTLDQVLAGVPDGKAIRLIKIDAEGCEYEVLQGAGRLIRERRPNFIILEIGFAALEQMQATPVHIHRLLEPWGYDCFEIASDFRLVPLPSGATRRTNQVSNVLYAARECMPEIAALMLPRR